MKDAPSKWTFCTAIGAKVACASSRWSSRTRASRGSCAPWASPRRCPLGLRLAGPPSGRAAYCAEPPETTRPPERRTSSAPVRASHQERAPGPRRSPSTPTAVTRRPPPHRVHRGARDPPRGGGRSGEMGLELPVVVKMGRSIFLVVLDCYLVLGKIPGARFLSTRPRRTLELSQVEVGRRETVVPDLEGGLVRQLGAWVGRLAEEQLNLSRGASALKGCAESAT